MDKSLAGLIGALAGLTAVAPAQAATAIPHSIAQALQAASYADLLAPIPNAAELLRAVQAQAENGPALAEGEAVVQDVQYHHHHHHRYYRRRRIVRHHHHHHHHHNFNR